MKGPPSKCLPNGLSVYLDSQNDGRLQLKVSQFCVVFTRRSGLLTPLGFELVTVLRTFYSESLCRSLLEFGCSRFCF